MKRAFAAFCAVAIASSLLVVDHNALARATGELVSVIVRELPGDSNAPERAVQELGGTVGRDIDLIDGFVARVPSNGLAALRTAPWVHSVTEDRRVRLLHSVDGFDGSTDAGSMYNTAASIKARDLWMKGITGAGVDVAMIDSGVVPVEGLTRPGKIVNGADLSFESQNDAYRYLDTYGHGTHMAGIIAGRDTAATDLLSHDNFSGIAPDARILSVKVAGADGATDVSQVIAAIDWVVQHRNDNGMNVRVLNLSFGTDGTQDYRLDPLAYAAEVAWHKGIVVVVAAGNSQFGTPKLNNPAYNPYVLAVGASDTKGTYDIKDDIVPTWSALGDGVRNPDLVAPGKSVVSLRAPGSYVDGAHPEGKVNGRFFRGSGTSQAAAAAAGAAALLIQQRPSITPDQVKALLTSTANKLPVADAVAQGAGLIDLKAAMKAPTPSYVQTWERATGTGSLEAARGSVHLIDPDGAQLTGEQDIFGSPWDGQSWSGQSWSGQSWSGGMWNGQSWSGQSWSGQSWSGQSWSGQSWSGQSWSGQSWSGQSWSGQSWSGQSWSGQSWSGQSWSGQSWSGQSWSGQSWSGQSWSGQSWSSAIWGSDYVPGGVCDEACQRTAAAELARREAEARQATIEAARRAGAEREAKLAEEEESALDPPADDVSGGSADTSTQDASDATEGDAASPDDGTDPSGMDASSADGAAEAGTADAADQPTEDGTEEAPLGPSETSTAETPGLDA